MHKKDIFIHINYIAVVPVGDRHDLMLTHVLDQSSLCTQRMDLDLVDGGKGQAGILMRGEVKVKRLRMSAIHGREGQQYGVLTVHHRHTLRDKLTDLYLL